MNTIPTAVLGASGYTGQEAIRLIDSHPALSLVAASSESEAGRPVGRQRVKSRPLAEIALTDAEVVLCCLPTGESAEWALAAREAGARVIDLSADLRGGEHGAIYGVPELWRESVRTRELVANPGCYPTGILLSMAAPLTAGMVDTTRAIMIDAASGVTGAGRSARRDMLFGEVADDYRAYGVGNAHRHVPEIAAGLARLNGGEPVEFVFTPHLLPVRRGILETIYLPVQPWVTTADIREAVARAYAEEPFVEVVEDGLPSLRDVVGRNLVSIGFAEVAHVSAPLVLCVVAFDNLLKGAAGQAVQNANLMLGLPEWEGLPR